MLLVDDLLASPVKGILWVFKEIHKAATEQQQARREQIMADLSALYISLEQGEINDAVFDTREQALLDELDALDASTDAEDEDDEDEESDAESGSTVTVAGAYPDLRNALVAPPDSNASTPPRPVTKKDLVS